MTNIFVDPVIVALPPDATGREGIVAWVQNLEIWLKEALSTPFLWLHARNITEQLEANGHLPNFETLRRWVNQYALDVNPKLLARDVNTFFRDAEHDLENKLLDLGYAAEGDPVTIEPGQIVARWPGFIHNEMRNLLATCCICKHVAHPFARDLHIVTLKLADQSQEMSVSALIKDAIPDAACSPGDTITQTFPLLFTPENLLPLIDVLALWHEGASGITYAIEQQFRKEWSHEVSKPMRFTFGPHFLESIENGALDSNKSILSKIIRCAADVIADRAKDMRGYELEQVRKSKSGSSSGRVRVSDGATAWRLRITRGGAGWRLHYWHIPGVDGGMIEFWNVEKETGSIDM